VPIGVFDNPQEISSLYKTAEAAFQSSAEGKERARVMQQQIHGTDQSKSGMSSRLIVTSDIASAYNELIEHVAEKKENR
jgi:hypothetical protein